MKKFSLIWAVILAALLCLGASKVQVLIYKDPGYQGDWAREAEDGQDQQVEEISGTAVPYWHQGTVYTWVKLNLSSGANEIWVYYGSATAPDESNGAAVFEFFDDFSVDRGYPNIGVGTGEYSVSDGTLWMRELSTGNIAGYDYALKIGDFPLSEYPLGSLQVEAKLRVAQQGELHAFLFTPAASSPYNAYKVYGTQPGDPKTGLYLADVTYPGSGDWEVVGAVLDDSTEGNFVAIAIDDDQTTGAEHCLDWIRIRKDGSSPSVSYGSEESGIWAIDDHVFTNRRKVIVDSSGNLGEYQVRLDYSHWGEPNIRVVRQE